MQIRLKAHAIVLALSFTTLIGVLGARAYGVARIHFIDMKALATHDLQAQAILSRIESAIDARDQAITKLTITKDRAYRALARLEDKRVGDLNEELLQSMNQAYPSLQESASGLQTREQVQDLRMRMSSRRQEKLARADSMAYGLLRLIVAAALMATLIAAWLFYVFYRGLVLPLRRLEEATTRVKSGDFTHRIQLADRMAVAELGDLSRSFNGMADRLESLDKAKSEFLSTVSHEFKNPLAALKEGLDLLSNRPEALSPANRSRVLGACSIATQRLEKMINNVLRHAHGETGLYHFSFSRNDLAKTVRAAIEEATPLTAARRISITYDGPSRLETFHSVDGISQTLGNLLGNAIKYGNPGSTVQVALTELERSAEIVVSNPGKPISASELEKIFDRSYRASNSDRQRGLGLGLYVVKRVVEAHQGAVTAASTDDRTTFTVRLPKEAPNRLTAKPTAIAGASLMPLVTAFLLGVTGCATPASPLPPLEGNSETMARRLSQSAGAAENVLVRTDALRDLLKERQALDERCRTLEAKLRALKNLDMRGGQGKR